MDPLSSFTAISISDPAIDKEKSNLDKYNESRDKKHLVIIEGATPVEYRIRRLTSSEMAKIMDMPTMYRQFRYAFLAACIEYFDGTNRVKPDKTFKDPETKKELATDDWADLISEKFGYLVVHEIGGVALNFAGLRPEQYGPLA